MQKSILLLCLLPSSCTFAVFLSLYSLHLFFFHIYFRPWCFCFLTFFILPRSPSPSPFLSHLSPSSISVLPTLFLPSTFLFSPFLYPFLFPLYTPLYTSPRFLLCPGLTPIFLLSLFLTMYFSIFIPMSLLFPLSFALFLSGSVFSLHLIFHLFSVTHCSLSLNSLYSLESLAVSCVSATFLQD